MGMSSYVYGIKPANDKYKKMLEIYNLCEEQNIDIPDEIQLFFDGKNPDPKGVIIDLTKVASVNDYNEDMREGFEVDLTKLSDDIKIIRFVNSY